MTLNEMLEGILMAVMDEIREGQMGQIIGETQEVQKHISMAVMDGI